MLKLTNSFAFFLYSYVGYCQNFYTLLTGMQNHCVLFIGSTQQLLPIQKLSAKNVAVRP